MVVVIFRARVRALDDEYARVASAMRELAFSRFGCLDFRAWMEGDEEIALSWWPDEEAVRAWKAHPEHVLAQQQGRQRWYSSWSVQVAEVTREYRRP